MSKRSDFIKDVFYNGKNGTWDDYAIKYDFKDAKQANDYWRWFTKNGSVEGCWEPKLVNDTDSLEEVLDIKEDFNPEELSKDNSVTSSPLWKEFLEFRLSKKKDDYIVGQHIIIPCLHAPFHNVSLLNSCLNLIQDINPKGLHIIGDFLDMNSLSSHDKGNVPIPGITLEFEYSEGNKILDQLESSNNWEVKNYIWGNHENRHSRHMAKVDNAKYGNVLASPTKALSLIERGYNVEEDWQQGMIPLGKYLELVHGSYFNVFSAKKHIDVYRTSTMYAHTHRIQQYVEGNVGGYNIGWMGNINSPAFNYASRGQREGWNCGFAIVDIDEDGYYFVNQIIWQNNKFYYAGKKY